MAFHFINFGFTFGWRAFFLKSAHQKILKVDNVIISSLSFYLIKDEKEEKENEKEKMERKDFKQNLIFFWVGGFLIILMLSYISKVILAVVENIHEDFSFLINVFKKWD